MINVTLIKEKAKTLNMTLKTLAESVGMSEGGFHTALANGSLKVDVIERLATTLDLNIDEIIIMEPKSGTTIKSKVKQGVGAVLGVSNHIHAAPDTEAQIRILELEKELAIAQAQLQTKEELLASKEMLISELKDMLSMYKANLKDPTKRQ